MVFVPRNVAMSTQQCFSPRDCTGMYVCHECPRGLFAVRTRRGPWGYGVCVAVNKSLHLSQTHFVFNYYTSRSQTHFVFNYHTSRFPQKLFCGRKNNLLPVLALRMRKHPPQPKRVRDIDCALRSLAISAGHNEFTKL